MKKRAPSVVLMAFTVLVASTGVSRAQTAAAGRVPTWTEDVGPILAARCMTCHRPGEIAPMSLLAYDEARPWARSIKNKVVTREMPPGLPIRSSAPSPTLAA